MNRTALGTESTKKENIIFISDAHEKFYYEKLKEVSYQDVYHKTLCYCLGISDDARRTVMIATVASGHNIQKLKQSRMAKI
jgi:hypothetical protein